MNQTIFSDQSFKFLTDLLEARGPSGFETDVATVVENYAKSFGVEVTKDHYGNVVAKYGQGDPIVLTGHGDEIGLIINYIEDTGFLRFRPIGGIDRKILSSQRVFIKASNGSFIPGVIGSTPIHLRDYHDNDTPKFHEFYIDVGAKDAAEVSSMGIHVGSYCVPQDTWQLFPNNLIVSRALDNRIGVFAAFEALKNIKESGKQLGYKVCAISTVQEEVGLVGAKMISNLPNLVEAYVVDVTFATDFPGASQAQYGSVKIGNGPVLTHGGSSLPRLVNELKKTARERHIAIQEKANGGYGGTDTDAIYTKGIPSVLVSLPNRNMHTTTELSSLKDLKDIVELLTHQVLKTPVEF